MSGLEVLAQLKADPELRRIPVIVLSSSRSPRDIALCYEQQACSFVAKPMNVTEFGAAMSNLERFWFETAELPV